MSDQELSEPLASLDAAAEEVVAALRRLAESDPLLAVKESLVVNDRLENIAEAVADQRALAVETIWRREELSLARLGERLRVSKPRAQQLVDRGKRLRESDRNAGADAAGRGGVGGRC